MRRPPRPARLAIHVKHPAPQKRAGKNRWLSTKLQRTTTASGYRLQAAGYRKPPRKPHPTTTLPNPPSPERDLTNYTHSPPSVKRYFPPFFPVPCSLSLLDCWALGFAACGLGLRACGCRGEPSCSPFFGLPFGVRRSMFSVGCSLFDVQCSAFLFLFPVHRSSFPLLPLPPLHLPAPTDLVSVER